MEFKFSKIKVIFQLIAAVALVVAGVVTLVMAEGRDEPVPNTPNISDSVTEAPPIFTAAPQVTTDEPEATQAPPVTTENGGEATGAPSDETTAETEAVTEPPATEPPVSNPYNRLLTLGAFNASNSGTQRGWETDGINGRSSPYNTGQFTSAKYLIIELEEIPEGVNGFGFAWRSAEDGLHWNQRVYRITATGTSAPVVLINGTTWVIDISAVEGAANFTSARSEIEMFVWVDNLVWGTDIHVKEAYLAN
jgi:hypothetical protein